MTPRDIATAIELIILVCILFAALKLYRADRKLSRQFDARMAALHAQHARQRAALAQFSAIYDDWQSGRASHEQVEAAYDAYQRVCDGDEVQA